MSSSIIRGQANGNVRLKRSQSHNSLPHEVVLSGWGNASVIRVDDNQLFLLYTNGERRFLFKGKENCSVSAVFLNEDHVLIETCTSDNVVVNTKGIVQYKLRKFGGAYVAVSSTGKNFAVYERGSSIWHQISDGTYNHMRLEMYSTDSGKKLLKYGWSAQLNENLADGNIYFSDDGSVLYLRRSSPEITAFPVNTKAK